MIKIEENKGKTKIRGNIKKRRWRSGNNINYSGFG